MHSITISCHVLVILLACTITRAQVGLWAEPLTSLRSQDGDNRTLGRHSKWTDRNIGPRINNSRNFESSLAAIFREVAYGASPTPPSTTTTLRRPSRPPLPDLHFWERNEDHSISTPNWPSQPEAGSGPQETPVNRNNDGDHSKSDDDSVTTFPGETKDSEVVRADTGRDITRVPWVDSLGTAWLVHVYCTAGLHSFLAVLAVFWVTRHPSSLLLPRGYYITLHLLMLLSAFLHCTHLLHDPYGAEERMPVMSAITEESTWPCLTAAVGVVALALVKRWHCSNSFPCVSHMPIFLAVLTGVHILGVITCHVLAALLPTHGKILRVVLQAITAAWGGTVGFGSLVTVWLVGRAEDKHRRQPLVRPNRPYQEESQFPQQQTRIALLQASRLFLLVSFAQILLAGMHGYALVGPHYLFDLPPMHPWHWLAYQSSCRVLEVLMWLLLGITSTFTIGDPSADRNSSKQKYDCSCCLTADPSSKIDEKYPAVNQATRPRGFSEKVPYGVNNFQDGLNRQPVMYHDDGSHSSSIKQAGHKSVTFYQAKPEIHSRYPTARNHSFSSPVAKNTSTSEGQYNSSQFEYLLQNQANCEIYCEVGDSVSASKENLTSTSRPTGFHSPALRSEGKRFEQRNIRPSTGPFKYHDARSHEDLNIVPQHQVPASLPPRPYASLRPKGFGARFPPPCTSQEGDFATASRKTEQEVDQESGPTTPLTPPGSLLSGGSSDCPSDQQHHNSHSDVTYSKPYRHHRRFHSDRSR